MGSRKLGSLAPGTAVAHACSFSGDKGDIFARENIQPPLKNSI
jgi:hypothetical protein